VPLGVDHVRILWVCLRGCGRKEGASDHDKSGYTCGISNGSSDSGMPLCAAFQEKWAVYAV
ncbi:MAG: hypothetical protein ACLFSA_01505, partial [Spirochaetaceae bacterium]